EARFLRAYQYWVLMDMYGNPPFVDENSTIGTTPPKQISRDDLFHYIENELIDIQPDLLAPRQNEYGRADRAADWALLARMYLNAEVYTDTARYTDAITYASKVIQSGYSLMPEYSRLFMADNNVNNPQTLLLINYEGNVTQIYGGTPFLVDGLIVATIPGVPDAYG